MLPKLKINLKSGAGIEPGIGLIISLALSISCASTFSACVSQPTVHATADDSAAARASESIAPVTEVSEERSGAVAAMQIPELRYNVPVPTAAQGTFTVRDFGPTRLNDKKRGGEITALHIQVVVDNRADAPWTLDTRAQQLRIENGAPVRPAFARAHGDQLPFVTIAASQRQALDLYYVLPASVRGLGDMQTISLDWQLITDEKIVDNVSSFKEISRRPTAAVAGGSDQSSRLNKNTGDSISGVSAAQGAALARPEPVVGESWWEDPFVNVGEPWKDSLR